MGKNNDWICINMNCFLGIRKIHGEKRLVNAVNEAFEEIAWHFDFKKLRLAKIIEVLETEKESVCVQGKLTNMKMVLNKEEVESLKQHYTDKLIELYADLEIDDNGNTRDVYERDALILFNGINNSTSEGVEVDLEAIKKIISIEEQKEKISKDDYLKRFAKCVRDKLILNGYWEDRKSQNTKECVELYSILSNMGIIADNGEMTDREKYKFIKYRLV